MHSYCRRKGSKFRKLSPISNTVYLLQTYGVMSSAPWFLPLEIQDAETVQRSVEKSPTAVGDISINRWRYFQQPLNYSFVQEFCLECDTKISYVRGKCKKKRKSVSDFFVNLYKEYSSLKSRALEELPHFGVMSWQPSQLPWSASLCLFG